MTSAAAIPIAWSLFGGRILVDGLFDGDLDIDRSNNSTSLIHLLGGLGANGTISINAGDTNNTAEGDILVDPASVGIPPPPPITYDGCIQILDNGAGGSGALIGT